jgi:hypothetical protein
VNRRGEAGHDPGLQRHHLLPVQLVSTRSLGGLVDAVGRSAIGFDDFRRNGLLLPATDQSAQILRLPLHRGPHRCYNEAVLDRVGRIEAAWARSRAASPQSALSDACFRLELLQSALRRRLLSPAGKAMVLNRRDPALMPAAFDDLDAMAEMLWVESGFE